MTTSLDEVFSLAYEELHRLAAAVRRDDGAATASATTLVNEAWLKLRGSPELADTSPLHFRRIAARAMRQVLVEAARRRHAVKRGGDQVRVTLDEGLHGEAPALDVLALDDALHDLATLSPRQAAVVESRFFGGLDVAETAAALGISEATVLRDWRAARAFLALAVREG
ncbi:MAG: ECF-type sigma factor [Gemmatimonadales bacterium]|jgi:RNA polymerase sigma factor (TIGR02999 family)|nr:ECF-type sigma factor [Gemmatimonadales bacterium]